MKGSAGQSSRRQAAQRSDPLDGRVRSGRTQQAGDTETDPMLKKVMFYGTGALVIVLIVLFIIKAPIIFDTRTPPPPPPKVDHTKILDSVDDLAKQARKQFDDAKRIANDADRNKAIRGALETLAAAQEKLQELSQRPEYRGEDYDQVFEETQHKLSQEMKTYRDAIRVGAGR